MSRSRGHGNVFVDGAEGRARVLINSKASHYMFIVNFLQRRMNTSYQKTLYWDQHQRRVYVRERWDVKNHPRDNYTGSTFMYPQSVIELVRASQVMGEPDMVIGRAFADGSVWLDERTIRDMKWRMRFAIEQHLEKAYDFVNGHYFMKGNARVQPRVEGPVAHTDSFADVINREWRI